jgi:hypothetical protein
MNHLGETREETVSQGGGVLPVCRAVGGNLRPVVPVGVRRPTANFPARHLINFSGTWPVSEDN